MLYSAELVVDTQGQGQYTSIRAALDVAPERARIIVRPGVYQEALLLDKTVSIQGEGARSDITVFAHNSSCIRVQTNEAMISGISLHCTSIEDVQTPCVDISQGQIVLKNCEIVSSHTNCLLIRNQGTQPHITDCVIHKSGSNGISITDHASGVIEDCLISGLRGSGIEIMHGANPLIRRCTIEDNDKEGVLIFGAGNGVIEECQIYRNLVGVSVELDGRPEILRCLIAHSKLGGIEVKHNSAGTIKGCQIFSNEHGIYISFGGNPEIIKCTISQNEKYAICADSRGYGTVIDCSLPNNGIGAWSIDSSSKVFSFNNQE